MPDGLRDPGHPHAEGAVIARVVDRGAAITATMRVLLRTGDHLLVSRWVPGETQTLLHEVLARLGASLTVVDPEAPREWQRQLQPTTRAILVESPVPQTGDPFPLRWPATLAYDRGIALLVHGTATATTVTAPLHEGADLVIADLHDPGTAMDHWSILGGAAPLVTAVGAIGGVFSDADTPIILGGSVPTRFPSPALE